MRIEETLINIIFDAGKGSVTLASREGTVGSRLGDLPVPVRSGYAFDGWYLGEKKMTPDSLIEGDSDLRLVAHWTKAAGEKKKNSVMRKQKIVAFVLAGCILFLGIAIAVANNLIAVYHFDDKYIDANNQEQSERYTVKKENGIYKLFNKDGELMETTENGYTANSTGIRYEVYVAKNSGNQYLINTKTGEHETYAIVDYDESIGETLGGTVVNRRVMMFPRVGQDNTFSIEVKNQYGQYRIFRKTVENTAQDAKTKYTTVVQIEGADRATYDPTLFASLCVSCGYTITLQKLDFKDPETPKNEDGSVRYSDYGLTDRYDAEGKLVYSPTVYTIVKADYAADGTCTASDTSYTVTVGDAILSGGGYYAKLEGRDAVYIMGADLEKTVLQPVEALVKPEVIYPMSMNTHVMVHNFRLGTIKGNRSLSDVTEEQLKDDRNIDIRTAFDFVDLEEREYSIFSSVPYWLTKNVTMLNGYTFNNDSVSTVLGNLYQMEFLGCKKLSPDPKTDFKEYNLDKDVRILSFQYDPKVAQGGSDPKDWVDSMIAVSQKTDKGTYYVYSYLFDMIVEVDQHYLSFLEWEESHWYNQYFFQHNIAYMKNIGFTVNGKDYDFVLDNRFSHAFYDEGDGKGKIIDLKKGTVSRNSDGSYSYTVTKTGKKYNVMFMDFSANRTFRDGKTGKIMYRSESGVLVEVAEGSNNMTVSSPQYQGPNGNLIDYVIEDTFMTDTGVEKTKTYTAIENFRRLYSKLLWYSIEGDVNRTEFEENLGSTPEEYIKNHDSSMEIRFSLEDMASILNPEHFDRNNKQNIVIRLYRYTEGKCLLTVEVLANETAVPNPSNAKGNFYVLAGEMANMEEYITDFLAGNLLPSTI